MVLPPPRGLPGFRSLPRRGHGGHQASQGGFFRPLGNHTGGSCKATAGFSWRARELETRVAWMRPPAGCPQPCGSLHGNFPQPAERTQGTAPTSPRPTPAGGSKTSHIHRMLPAPEPLLTPCASGRCRVVGAHGRPRLGTSLVGARGLLKQKTLMFGTCAKICGQKTSTSSGEEQPAPCFLGKRGAHTEAPSRGAAWCRRASRGSWPSSARRC